MFGICAAQGPARISRTKLPLLMKTQRRASSKPFKTTVSGITARIAGSIGTTAERAKVMSIHVCWEGS